MHLPFTLFLALRYMRSKRSFVSAVTIISIVGIMLGVAILLIVRSVMNGFDDMWREKILSFNAHVTVSAPSPISDADSLIARIRQVEGVQGAAPFVQGLVFLQRNNRVYTPIMRGIDPRYEKEVSRVPDYVRHGSFSVGEDEMMVGSDLARQMYAHVGDKILVYSPQRFTKADEVYLPEELTVSGIFDLGMWDFDIGYVLTSLEKARSLFQMEDGVQGVQVMTRDPMKVEVVAEALRARLGPGFYVTTWKEQNRTLFAQLEVENNLMLLLLAFILIVAGFAIASTLITQTFRKTREIGLLKSVGVASGQVLAVFVWQGFISGVIGTLLGLGLGKLVLIYRNDLLHGLRTAFGFDILPKELYHLAELPATTTMHDLVLIGWMAIVISSGAALFPAARAAATDPVRALRYE